MEKRGRGGERGSGQSRDPDDIIRFTSCFDPVSFEPNLNIIINYVV